MPDHCLCAQLRPFRIGLQFNVLRELQVTPTSSSTILDFGCGSGETVDFLCSEGYQAIGCDVYPGDNGRVGKDDRLLLMRNGRIPLPDNSVDIVLSESVFEHVMDFSQGVEEVCRVLKPGGFGLHWMPSRYYLVIEPHVDVPLAAFFRPNWWLWLWAHLGVHNSLQQNMSAEEVFRANCQYLRSSTNYRFLYDSALRDAFGRHCKRVEFREDLLLKYAIGRARKLWPLAQSFPVFTSLYRWFHFRLVACWK